MSNSQLPERASLEYLKKLAKDRLQELRRTDPEAKLATALLGVARDHGFPSWRALKAEIEQRQAGNVQRFFEACAKGEIDTLRSLLASDPALVRAAHTNEPHGGWTGLHEAAKQGQAGAVRVLLAHGANPNAREEGDNTYPLHWAAAHRDVESVRALLDAGGDVHGVGDLHELDTIGWATFFHPPGGAPGDHPEVASLLVERGARHHIFSAMSIGDLDLIRRVAEENPSTLDRRMSRFEHGLTAVHFAISRKRYDILELLIELGADLEAEDRGGQTALAAAMLHGDQEAMGRLHKAGAKPPKTIDTSSFRANLAKMAESVNKSVAMLNVPDVARALEWYESIGFKEIGRHEYGGVVNWGMLSFGKAELMLNVNGKAGPRDTSLWFYMDRVDELYQVFKARQLEAAQAALTGRPGEGAGVEFEQDIGDMPYNARQFGIRDLNGYVLYFIQPLD
jgi:ankyrin repeat protein